MKSFRSCQRARWVLFLLGIAVAVVLPVIAGRTNAQTPKAEKRSRTKWEWNDDGWHRRVEVHGKAEFNEQYSDVSAVSEDGLVILEEKRHGNVQRLEVRRDPSGQLVRRYFVDGELRALDENGRKWVAGLLLLAVAPVVQNELRALEPALTIYNVRTLLEHVGRSLYVERMETIIFGLLGLLALVLTAIGVYGVVAYSVAQRTHELGIRMALGAQKMDVLKLILVKGLVLVAWGAGIGLVASYWLSRLIANQLYGVSPSDPVTLVSVAVLLGGVALLASYIPARRATKVDPLVALRYE